MEAPAKSYARVERESSCCTYFRIQVVNLSNSRLHVSIQNCVPDMNPLINVLGSLGGRLNIGFRSKFLCRSGISFAYEVVHYDMVDVPSWGSN